MWNEQRGLWNRFAGRSALKGTHQAPRVPFKLPSLPPPPRLRHFTQRRWAAKEQFYDLM